ncbi:MAG: ATP-dependent Clp protease ATP-binding subunit, partial [Pseudonocardiales bacterium]|nr:ATP-dependent Clp protease ATP-binding subunit [Pseudonocardiales bacterium]
MPEGPFGSGFNPLEELVRGLAGGLEQAFGGLFDETEQDDRGPRREGRRPDDPAEAGRAEPGRPRARPTPKLNRYGRDLTAAARAGLLDPVIGRDDEVAQVLEVLARRSKNNPVLLG